VVGLKQSWWLGIFISYNSIGWQEMDWKLYIYKEQLTKRLKQKTKNIWYQIYVCSGNEHSATTCSWYNLAHPFQYFQCNELFTIEKSIVHLILHKSIYVNLKPLKNLHEWTLDLISI